MNLSEEEREEVERVLNTMSEASLNILALDKKYGLDWYKEKRRHLKELDEYLSDVERVAEMNDDTTAVESISDDRSEIGRFIQMTDSAIEDLESTSSSDRMM